MVQYTCIHGTITTLIYIGVPDIYIHVHANIHDKTMHTVDGIIFSLPIDYLTMTLPGFSSIT